MSYITVEVEIDHGRIVARKPNQLPDSATGLLTIFSSKDPKVKRERVRLPLIQGDGKRMINPTAQELDASFWGD
jgi:hypothetical protein